MSEENAQGPAMMVLTDILRNQRTRVGRIAGNITLPRPVELRTLVAIGVGAFVGLLVGLIINAGDPTALMYGAGIGGAAGWGAVNWSPLQGETLATWIMLTVRTKGGATSAGNKGERVAIGIAYLPELARGEVRIKRGAVPVPAGSVDDRGVFLPLRDTTLPAELREELAAWRGTQTTETKFSTDEPTPRKAKGARNRPQNLGRIAAAQAERDANPTPWRDPDYEPEGDMGEGEEN